MVTAMNGSFLLKGQSGKVYSYNFYSSDVIGAFCTLSASGVAGTSSTNFTNAPENCYILDIASPASNTVSTNFVFYMADTNLRGIFPIANTLNTLANRVVPNITFANAQKITMVQA